MISPRCSLATTSVPPLGARIVYLVKTAKLNRASRHDYLKAMLGAIANGHPVSEIDQLLPRGLYANLKLKVRWCRRSAYWQASGLAFLNRLRVRIVGR